MKRLCLILALLLLVPTLCFCTPEPSLPVTADPQTGDAEDTTEPTVSDTEPDVASETVPGEDTEIPAETEPLPPETLSPEDVILILPSLAGMSEAEAIAVIDAARTGTSLGEDLLSVQVEYGSYPLPAGCVYDAAFVGEKAEDAYFVQAIGGIVLQVSRGIPWENVTVPKGDRTVYLTFDDGPNPKHTEQILDVLKEYDIKATFFAVGRYLEKYPEIARPVQEE